MRHDYVADILRATGSLRVGDPAGVTTVIQNALAAAGLTISSGNAPPGTANADVELPQMPLPGAAHRAEYPSSPTDRIRRPLSEVLRTLRAGGNELERLPGLGQPARTPDLPLPGGAKFLDLRYSCEAGTRRYRLYVPSSSGEAPT